MWFTGAVIKVEDSDWLKWIGPEKWGKGLGWWPEFGLMNPWYNPPVLKWTSVFLFSVGMTNDDDDDDDVGGDGEDEDDADSFLNFWGSSVVRRIILY